MKKAEHQWDKFYSPRNGRISIEACNICGVAKGLVLASHECSETSESLRHSRLRGWTTQSRMDKQNVELPQDNHAMTLIESLKSLTL